MTKKSLSCLLFCVTMIPLAMGQMCFFSAPDDGSGGGSNNDLTQVERSAIKAAVQAAGAFSQAANASQGATGQQSPSGDPKPGDLTVGTCPEVTTSTVLGEAALDVTIDFKTGCTLPMAPDYTCSGSATGQLDVAAKTLDLDFNAISCTGDTALTGAVSVNYALSTGEVALDGEWDLTYGVEGNQITTFGTGIVRYDLADLISRIAEFQGLLAEGDNDWDMTMTDVVVSYADNQSYLPYGGTITVSGHNIRQLTIRFNENSPSTGEIELSIDGGDFFTVNIYEL